MRPDRSAIISGEVLYRMTYTRTVVKEILRFRPPAPMVPQVQCILQLNPKPPDINIGHPAACRPPSECGAGAHQFSRGPPLQPCTADEREFAAVCRSCSRTSGSQTTTWHGRGRCSCPPSPPQRCRWGRC